MGQLKIRTGEWVVVCDGKKALLLENGGDEKFLNLKTREVFEHPDLKTSELGTDAPGRAMSSVGSGRSAMEPTDLHDQAEQRFLRDLLARLDAEKTAGRMETFVMVAPPRALGVLRQGYSATLKGALRGEVDKDLVRMPVHEIERHLVG